MASLQARHSRQCALVVEGRINPKTDGITHSQWTSFDVALDGCTCKKGPMYHVVSRDDQGKLVRDQAGHNRKQAERKLKIVNGSIEEGTYTPPSTVTFSEWGKKFLESLRRRETTKDQYRITINYGNAVFGTKKLYRLGPADATAMLDRIEDDFKRRHKHTDPERRPSEATLAKHLRQLSVVLEAAKLEGHLSVNPVSRVAKSAKPKARRGAPSYFTDGELARLWPEFNQERPYLYAAKLCATTGMRFGEVAGLRMEDVSLLEGEIRLSRQFTAGAEVDTTKGGKPRIVDLVPAAQMVLAEWIGPDHRGDADGLLFQREVGGHLDNGEARDLLYGAMERAGIPRVGEGGRKRDWHSLRHSFARVALENGALLQWVQAQLGHSSVTLTADLYGRWSRSAQKSEAKKLEGAFAV